MLQYQPRLTRSGDRQNPSPNPQQHSNRKAQYLLCRSAHFATLGTGFHIAANYPNSTSQNLAASCPNCREKKCELGLQFPPQQQLFAVAPSSAPLRCHFYL